MAKTHMSKDGNYQISIKTKIGYISIFADKNSITDIEFNKNVKANPNKLLIKTKKMIASYLSGEIVNFDNINVKLSENKRFYEYIRKIPYGKTKSYSEIGKHFNIHPRKVGLLLSKNRIPIIIPCHRIIYKNGKLGGFNAGKEWKKFLLKTEGNINIG